MVIRICPHCQTRYNIDKNCTDYVHQCNSGKNVLDQEDVVIISTQVEEFGATINTGKLVGDITKQGIGNEIAGTRGAIEGEDVDKETIRGNNSAITRQRQHYEYIKIK